MIRAPGHCRRVISAYEGIIGSDQRDLTVHSADIKRIGIRNSYAVKQLQGLQRTVVDPCEQVSVLSMVALGQPGPGPGLRVGIPI